MSHGLNDGGQKQTWAQMNVRRTVKFGVTSFLLSGCRASVSPVALRLHGIAFHQALPRGAMSPLLGPKQGEKWRADAVQRRVCVFVRVIMALPCMWTTSDSRVFQRISRPHPKT